jgi:hypothetical protein
VIDKCRSVQQQFVVQITSNQMQKYMAAKKIKRAGFLLAVLAMLAGSGVGLAQVTVPASFAHPKAQANTSKEGFRVRTVQIDRALEGRIAAAEAALAGMLTDSSGQPLPNVADTSVFGPDGYYNEEVAIDYEQNGGSTYGLMFPGIPGTTFSNDNFAVEAIAYLDLDAGEYTMGVNSDDGFRVTVGVEARDQMSAMELGVYDGARGAGDSIFTFTITKAGLYSFRLVYFEVGGGANVSWFMGDSKDTGVLLNDPYDPTSIKAYRELTTGNPPYFQIVQPSVGATAASPTAPISGVIVDGSTAQVVASSVELYLDGTKVNANPQKSGNKTTYSYLPPTKLKSRSHHEVRVIFADSTSTVRTNDYQFTVRDYIDVTLPAPFYLENFDALQEATLPAGWLATNYSSNENSSGYEDLLNPRSDSYINWVVISRTTLESITGFNPAQRLYVAPGQFINGQEVTSLVKGNFIYAESDARSGSQVQYLFTADINCTGKTNVFVVFNSIRTQNQDDIASVEYSIDSGATWLPILYMIDVPDIIRDASGNIDGYATLMAPHADAAALADPDTGEDIGHHYGAFIGVKSNLWSTLGPYISGRIDDDQYESKRVEMFRLEKADGQAKVRFRFAQAGTASWFFGIDDLGLYEIDVPLPPKITEQPVPQVVSAGASATFEVKVTGEELEYRWRFNGMTIPGATESTLTIPSAQAANAGDYSVIVSNAGGEAESAPAALTVFAGPITQDLVVHLKFDDNLTDSSGKGNHGTAVGSPTYDTGKIGKAVHIPSGFDYVTLETPADLNFGTDTDFSISFWAQTIGWSSDPVYIGNKNWNSGGNQGYVLATDSDLHFQWNLAGSPGTRKDYDGPAGALSNGWHHVVVTFHRAGMATSYIDGSQVNYKWLTANKNNVDTPAGLATNIGQDGTGTYGASFSDMDMDDVGIWRRVLTPQEVAAIYTAGGNGKDLSTVQVSSETPVMSIVRGDGSVTLSWTGGGTLQTAPTISGPWTDATSQANPQVVPTSGSSSFWRVKTP